MTTPLGKDLLGLEELSATQIELILDSAEAFKEVSERPIKKVPALRGKTIVNLFFEASTRTRISFEFAEKRLSADTVNVATQGSSVSKGETLVDTARNLEAMRIDMVVIRHHASGAARFLAERIRSNVINAGDGKHEHRCLVSRSRSAATSSTAGSLAATSGGSSSWGPRWRFAGLRPCCRKGSNRSA
jgi:aspartate carbamoyltransferase catalytic subunit